MIHDDSGVSLFQETTITILTIWGVSENGDTNEIGHNYSENVGNDRI